MSLQDQAPAAPARVLGKKAPPRKPQRPARLPEQAPERCACCNLEQAHSVQLAHQGTGERVTVCLRCLRSSMQMKADLSESRGPLMLRDYAEAFGWQVWTSTDVAYLLPSVAPFIGNALTPTIKPGV